MPAAPKQQVDYGAAFTSSGVCGGMDLADPLLSLECRDCGNRVPREKDGDGRWVMRLEVKCPKCGGKL